MSSPGRLWDTPCLMFIGCWGSHPGYSGRVINLATQPPSSAEVKKESSYILLPLYACTVITGKTLPLISHICFKSKSPALSPLLHTSLPISLPVQAVSLRLAKGLFNGKARGGSQQLCQLICLIAPWSEVRLKPSCIMQSKLLPIRKDTQTHTHTHTQTSAKICGQSTDNLIRLNFKRNFRWDIQVIETGQNTAPATVPSFTSQLGTYNSGAALLQPILL
jgi:hypothetical protein